MEVIISNPFECFSVVIDVKELCRKNFTRDVEYQLKKRYPYRPEKSVLNIKKSRGKIIATEIPFSFFNGRKVLCCLFPVYFLYKLKFDGLLLFLHDDWCVWMEKKNFKYTNHGLIKISCINAISEEDKKNFMNASHVILGNFDYKNSIGELISKKCNAKKIEDYEGAVKKCSFKIRSKSYDFIMIRKSYYISFYFMTVLILFLFNSKKSAELKKQKMQLKQKEILLRKMSSIKKENVKTMQPEYFSFLHVLNFLYEAENSIKVDTFSYDLKKFSVEGICKSSSNLIMKIKTNKMIRNVSLNSVTVLENDMEKFSITGELYE